MNEETRGPVPKGWKPGVQGFPSKLVPFGFLEGQLQFFSGCCLNTSPISLPCLLFHRTAHSVATGSH